MALPRAIRGQHLVPRLDQIVHLTRRPPRRRAVVDHHRQHDRQPAPFVQARGFVADQLLIQEARVGEDAKRHPRVTPRLELQHQQQGAAVPKSHLPHVVAMAPEPVVAYIVCGELAQRREVELTGPPAGGEAAKQVLDHARKGEDGPVEFVVHEGRR